MSSVFVVVNKAIEVEISVEGSTLTVVDDDDDPGGNVRISEVGRGVGDGVGGGEGNGVGDGVGDGVGNGVGSGVGDGVGASVLQTPEQEQFAGTVLQSCANRHKRPLSSFKLTYETVGPVGVLENAVESKCQ